VTKSAGLALIGFSDAYERLRPDLAVVLGDRYEILAAAIAAHVARIPTAHIGGGETTEGAIDEAIRHSITKMSCLHFTSTEAYRRRVIQLGEDPDTVFNVGALGLEHLRRTKLMSREELEASLGMELGSINFLVTYHPSTLGEPPEEGTAAMLSALDEFAGARIVFTYPNSDAGGRRVIEMIDRYVSASGGRSRAFVSLGQTRYLSVLRHFDAVIGNSSSGIIEAPSFKIPTVNIGERQRGRIRAESVIDCGASARGISGAIARALSPGFRGIASSGANPYEKDGSAAAVADVLMGHSPPSGGKKFRDLEF
jgi:UDP-hydrolysing UDP-N-acetyl-D-glucosamine 2-epimerase